MAKLIIPTPLRKFTNQDKSFSTDANTVDEAIDNLVEEYPHLRKNLLDDNNQVRSFIKIFVGEDEVKPENGSSVEVENDTVISIVPAIAGGCLRC